METPLGIYNIHVGLSDEDGRRVEALQVIPNNFDGEPKVHQVGSRLVEDTVGAPPVQDLGVTDALALIRMGEPILVRETRYGTVYIVRWPPSGRRYVVETSTKASTVVIPLD